MITASERNVLVVRFNSIGDIVLTSPVISRLHAEGYKVHYLTKKVFSELLENNPKVGQCWVLEDSLSKVIEELSDHSFKFVIDLHNNYRSKRVCKAISAPTYRLSKERIGMWLLTNFGIRNTSERHIVHRFLDVLSPLRLSSRSEKLEFYTESESIEYLALPEEYLAVAVGAAWSTKQIPTAKQIEIIEQSKWKNIVLLGGPDEKEMADEIVSGTSKKITNLVGDLSITQSGLVVKDASVLLTGDTGLMHIAAAVETPTVAVFGSTHPVLGYTPFTDEKNYYIIQNESLGCRPCTKQGKSACPKGHFKCMLDLDFKDLVTKIDKYI